MNTDHEKTKLTTNTALVKTYTIGFILSLILTLVAYFLVAQHVNSHHQEVSHKVLTYAAIGLAFVQLLVQLFFFLHLGREKKPRWNMIFLVSTVGLIFIVVVGSLWIMNHLNYNMTPSEMNNYILHEEGLHK